jgi:hypothetical protein
MIYTPTAISISMQKISHLNNCAYKNNIRNYFLYHRIKVSKIIAAERYGVNICIIEGSEG